MTNLITTPEAAAEFFFECAGYGAVDADDIAEAVREIGNPDANIHIVKTAETADDYRANGWADYSEEDGIIILRKKVGEHRTARGMAPNYHFVNIADCGDYRLVYVER